MDNHSDNSYVGAYYFAKGVGYGRRYPIDADDFARWYTRLEFPTGLSHEFSKWQIRAENGVKG